MQKRKADDLLKEKDVKRERVDSSGGLSDNAAKKTEPPIPYRGTARPLHAQSSSRPISKSAGSTPTPSGPIKPSSDLVKAPVASTPTAPAPAPRGFAAILARGQAASQSAATQSFGAIKHKPVEKLSRKERIAKEKEEQLAAAAKAKAAGAASKAKPGPNGSMKSAQSKSTEKQSDKSKREAVDLGYKGTARSVTEPTYKGTAHLAKSHSAKPKPYDSSRLGADRSRSTSATASARRNNKGARRSGYTSYSSAEEDDESGGYGSDASSDMEAGFNDVEYEERAALRAAMQDDAAELAFERQLKTDKERRKAALARLSAERAKKRA